LLRCLYDQFHEPNPQKVPSKRAEDRSVGFQHHSSILLFNQSSLKDLQRVVKDQYEKRNETAELANIDINMELFRPNLVIDEEPAYSEDGYRALEFPSHEGSENLKIHFHGHCQRCNAITLNLEQHTRNFDKEPYSTLDLYRREKSSLKPVLGILIHISNPSEEGRTLKVGDKISITALDASENMGLELVASELI